MNEKVLKELNEQLNFELYSAHIYLDMSARMIELGFDGFANWFKVQYEEENFHAKKQFEYLAEAGHNIKITGFKLDGKKYSDPVDAFKDALKHEKEVTSRINKLMKKAYENSDFATISFLQWFVLEQVEEESTLSKIISDLELVENGSALYQIDKEMQSRTFVEPTI